MLDGILAGGAPDDEVGRSRGRPGAVCARLRHGFARAHDDLRAELLDYLCKQDAGFAGEPAGAEQGSWCKAPLRQSCCPTTASSSRAPRPRPTTTDALRRPM